VGLNSSTRQKQAYAERQAINSTIQGSAGDLVKMAMIEIDSQFHRCSLNARIVLQIHDELIIESSDEELDEVVGVVRNSMENIYPLSTPLTVRITVGKTWGSLSPYSQEFISNPVEKK